MATFEIIIIINNNKRSMNKHFENYGRKYRLNTYSENCQI